MCADYMDSVRAVHVSVIVSRACGSADPTITLPFSNTAMFAALQ
jgi:hypothetical protein